jgi:hypothetical protein
MGRHFVAAMLNYVCNIEDTKFGFIKNFDRARTATYHFSKGFDLNSFLLYELYFSAIVSTRLFEVTEVKKGRWEKKRKFLS